MEGGGSATKSRYRTGIRIVVAGDPGSGKSSLILSAAKKIIRPNIPPVLPPTRLLEDMFCYRVPVTVIDTSSRVEDRDKLADELKRADAVVLTYACEYDLTSSIDRVTTFWLTELRRLEVRVPVIVVGCKLDKQFAQRISLEQSLTGVYEQFPEIELWTECSAYLDIEKNTAIFYHAQKAVLHSPPSLFDRETQTVHPGCERALKRIFMLSDHDKDGALTEAEMNDFQVYCHDDLLSPSDFASLKEDMQQLPGCYNDSGLTLKGFLNINETALNEGTYENMIWLLLRRYGYNNEFRLDDDWLLPPIARTPDQSVELTSEAIEFLKGVFIYFDMDGDGNLDENELDLLFDTAPER